MNHLNYRVRDRVMCVYHSHVMYGVVRSAYHDWIEIVWDGDDDRTSRYRIHSRALMCIAKVCS